MKVTIAYRSFDICLEPEDLLKTFKTQLTLYTFLIDFQIDTQTRSSIQQVSFAKSRLIRHPFEGICSEILWLLHIICVSKHSESNRNFWWAIFVLGFILYMLSSLFFIYGGLRIGVLVLCLKLGHCGWGF